MIKIETKWKKLNDLCNLSEEVAASEYPKSELDAALSAAKEAGIIDDFVNTHPYSAMMRWYRDRPSIPGAK